MFFVCTEMEESKEYKISEEQQKILQKIHIRELELDKIYDDIRDHVRQLESRIVMIHEEEVAREAMVVWLEKEADILEREIIELQKQLETK